MDEPRDVPSSEKQINFMCYKKGDIDQSGVKITHIFAASTDYVIYQTNRSSVRYEGRINSKDLALMNQRISRFWSLLVNKFERKKFASRIADAYQACFDGNPDTAVAILGHIEKSVTNYKFIKGRLLYSLSCLFCVFVNIFIVLASKYYFAIPESIIRYLIVATYGSFGGFLSVSIRMKKLDIDLDSGNLIHILTGFTRIFISMISSIILFILITSNFIIGFINQANNNFNAICGLSVLAGFSETFIPNILKQLEKKQSDNN